MGRIRRLLRILWFILYPAAFIGVLTLRVEPGTKMFLIIVLSAGAAATIFLLYRERRHP